MYIALSEEEKEIIKSMTPKYSHICDISNLAHMGIGSLGFARLIGAGLVEQFTGDNMYRLTKLGQVAKEKVKRGDKRFCI